MFRHAHAKEEDSKLQRTKRTTKRASVRRGRRLRWGMQRYGMRSPRLLQHIMINYDTLWCSFCDAQQTHTSSAAAAKVTATLAVIAMATPNAFSSECKELTRNTARIFIPSFYHSLIIPPGTYCSEMRAKMQCSCSWSWLRYSSFFSSFSYDSSSSSSCSYCFLSFLFSSYSSSWPPLYYPPTHTYTRYP